jgi:flagellar hook protein FlgE
MSITPANNVMATAVSGLKRAENNLDDTAQNIAEGSLDPKDIVELSQTSNDFKANTAVIRTENEMSKSLLDIVA